MRRDLGSLAAAVKASQYESREAWPPGGLPPGEGVGGMGTDAAAKNIFQVEGERLASRGCLKRTDRHCKRLQRLVWRVQQAMFCCDQCKMFRQGGHRGAVGRVKSGEG